MNHLKHLILVIILIGIILRILGLGLNIYTDESIFLIETKDGFEGFGQIINMHPPLSNFFYSLSTTIFGVSNFSMRIVPFTFGILTLIFTYLLTKQIYNDKNIAIASVFLLSISFWHIIASLQIDIDGALLSFLFIAIFFFYLKYEHTKKKTYLIVAGGLFGLGALTKYPIVLVIPIITCYLIFSKNSIKHTIIITSIITFIGLLLFSIFPIISFISGSPYFYDTLKHSSGRLNFSLLPIIYFIIWATPLLILPLIFFKHKQTKNSLLLIIWIAIPILFYIFIGTPYQSPYDRYLMIIIPPLAILGGEFIVGLGNFNKKHLFVFTATMLIAFFFLISLNLTTNIIPHGIPNYLKSIEKLNWRFYFPITGSSGPMTGIDFSSYAIVYIISIILGGLILYLKKTKGNYLQYLLSVFLAINIALNLFISQEAILNLTTPNFNKAISDTRDYFFENNLKLPIYTNQLSFLPYLNLENEYNENSGITKNYFSFTYNTRYPEINLLNERIISKGGTILVVDFPVIDKNSDLWNA
ncbi:MAG: glycosyltransferase family 39 protein, partial [Nanoarchaeota archaeon]